MQFSTFAAVASTLLVSGSLASPHHHPHIRREVPEWHPPGLTDFRGPCPMMNTLANHGYLPHDGRNITREVVIDAMGSALNFNASLAVIMFDAAVFINPEPNATYFSLDDLNRHNVLEHDASLSRQDAYFGNNHIFDAGVFAESKAYWTDEIMTPTMLANSKLARQITSRANNPNYTFTSTVEAFSLGEVAAPIIAFGDLVTGDVNRSLVEYFFENERLPTELGWSRKTEEVTLEAILAVSDMVGSKVSLLTDEVNSTTTKRSLRAVRDLHSGLGL